MSTSTRRAGGRPLAGPVYIPSLHGVFDPGTGTVRPDIDARARQSAVDALAEQRGTHAAPPSEEFSRAFTPRGQRAGVQTMGEVTQAPPRGAGAKPIDDGSATVTRVPAGGGAAAPARAGAGRLDVNSNAVQALLDRAAGIPVAGTVPANGVTKAATSYGTGSVRFDKGPAGASAPIVEGGKEIGVGRAQPFDLGTARANLYAAHPQIFQAGTAENKAFVDYAQKHGEQAAHQNITGIMQPFTNDRIAAAGGTGPSAAQVRSDLPAAGSTADVEAKAAIAKNMPKSTFKPGSVMDKAVGAWNAVKNLPNTAGDLVASGFKAVGVQDDTAKGFGARVAKAVTPDAPTLPPLANRPSWPSGADATRGTGGQVAQHTIPNSLAFVPGQTTAATTTPVPKATSSAQVGGLNQPAGINPNAGAGTNPASAASAVAPGAALMAPFVPGRRKQGEDDEG